MSQSHLLLTLAALLLLPASVLACLWDYDTLQQERSRFPSTLELITGKFLRHSPEFYRWRIQDRKAKLDAGASDPGLYDDLAVAYQLTGQKELAIATMVAKEKLHPGLYETASNLGTFHILNGDFEKGLPLIDQALAINPDAHFGREKYQKWLVEHALIKRDALQGLPHPLGERYDLQFATFLAIKLNVERLEPAERDKAIRGVQGMMRFADHRNPLLLEALGELLQDFSPRWDAKMLSARAYLQASYQVEDEAREEYRKLAERSLSNQTTGWGETRSMKLAELEPTFQAELREAEQWYAELREREASWIAQGLNADAEFDRLYPTEPLVSSTATLTDPRSWPLTAWLAVGLLGVLAVGLCVWLCLRSA